MKARHIYSSAVIVTPIILVFIFLNLTSCRQSKIDYRDYFEIKGKFKKIDFQYTLYSDDDTISYDETWTFNDDGQLLKKESSTFEKINLNRKVIDSIIYSYENGFLKFEETFDSVGNTKFKYEITKHNDKGFPSEYRLIKGENAINRMECSFMEKSKEVLSFDNDLLIDRYTTLYDNNKNVIAEKLEWLYEPDTSVTYNREIDNLTFDNQGNWTKRIVKEIENHSYRTEERKINYN